jgi:hypothetical protein
MARRAILRLAVLTAFLFAYVTEAPVSRAQTPRAADYEEKLKASDLPPDVRLVTWAILLGLVGESIGPSDGVVLDPTSALILGSNPDFFRGLALSKTTISNYRTIKGDQPRMGLDGTFTFANAAGRRTAAFYSADYGAAEGFIAIERASVIPLYPPEPKPDVFVIPASRAPDGVKAAADDFDRLYAFAAARALKVRGGEAPVAELAPYLLVLAFPDRLPSNAKVDITLSPTPQPKRAADLYDFNGWRIYVLRADLALGSQQPKLKVSYTSTIASQDGKPVERVVGEYALPKAKTP